MTLQEAQASLLKEANTPVGKLTLYGINLIPDSEVFGLIFYIESKRVIFFPH